MHTYTHIFLSRDLDRTKKDKRNTNDGKKKHKKIKGIQGKQPA